MKGIRFMKYILLVLVSLAFSACSVAEKTEEIGKGMSNVNNPFVFSAGIVLYKTASVFKEKKEEKTEEEKKENE